MGQPGVIETAPFVLGEEALVEFLIGGGNHPWDMANDDPDAIPDGVAALNLEVMVGPGDWEVLFSATGPNANTLTEMSWDASDYEGETVRLRIYDTATGGWGHIDLDNIIVSQNQQLAVPEPTSWMLWIGIGLVLSWMKWRSYSRK